MVVELEQDLQRSPAAVNAQVCRQLAEQAGGLGEMAGQKHVEIVAVRQMRIERRPIGYQFRIEAFEGRRRLDFHNGLRGDANVGLPAGNVKVMHGVAQKIPVKHDIGLGSNFQGKREAALASFAARLHVHFHHQLVDLGLVAEISDVANGVSHRFFLCPVSTGRFFLQEARSVSTA